MNKTYVECACHSPEHLLILDPDEELEFTYCYVALNKEHWFKRIILAIKYILGYQSKYGHFDEFIINKENAQKIIETLNSSFGNS